MKTVYLNNERTAWIQAERFGLVVFAEVTCGGHRTQSRAAIPWRLVWEAKQINENARKDRRKAAERAGGAS